MLELSISIHVSSQRESEETCKTPKICHVDVPSYHQQRFFSVIIWVNLSSTDRKMRMYQISNIKFRNFLKIAPMLRPVIFIRKVVPEVEYNIKITNRIS